MDTAAPAPDGGRYLAVHLSAEFRELRRRSSTVTLWASVAFFGWWFLGSLLATYGMARGWVEFWLIWIAVDAVGVPLLLRGGFYPSAAMYLVYGAFCAAGLYSWWRTSRAVATAPAPIPATYSEAVA